jgi:hypothetical protein
MILIRLVMIKCILNKLFYWNIQQIAAVLFATQIKIKQLQYKNYG